jgi:uncharacterized Zn-finger protein
MSSFGRFAAILITIVMVILLAVLYISQGQGEMIDSYAYSRVAEFTDTARHQGYISRDMYEDLINDLDQTGELYDLSIETAHPVSGKEVTENTLGDQTPDLKTVNTSFTDLSDEKSELTGNTISLLAAHMHTDACYDGTLHSHNSNCYTSYPVYHSHTGNSSSGGGCYGSPNYHTHTSGCYTTSPCGGSISHSVRNSFETYCSRCGKNVTATNYNQSCSKCGWSSTGGTVFSCGHMNTLLSSCSRSIDRLTCTISTTVPVSYSLNCGKTTSTVEYYNNYLTCGKTAGAYYNGNTLVSPICNTVVVSITATNPSQSIIEGGTIVTTATAAYLDGHTGTVSCTASGFNGNTIGNQTVTLTYNGLVGNAKTTGTRTCMINVTVLANKIPMSLTVVPSSSSVYNGSEPTYTVAVTYSDNTTKTLISGQYTKTGWSLGPGTKTVVFSYTENSKTVTKSVTITVLPNVSSLSVTPSASTVYNGAEPSYTVVVTYENNSTKTLGSSQYTKTGWSSGAGIKTVTFSYTENSVTVTKSISITVLPNLTGITVTPSVQSITRYTNPSLTVRVYYENNTNKVILNGYTVSGLNVNNLGTQTVTISYKENGITKSATATVTVVNLTKVCPVCGTTYNLDANDKDNGCPNCKSAIIGINAAPSIVSINKGEALPITVTALYRNGSTAQIAGWVCDYDPSYVGIQSAIVSYQGFQSYLTIEIKLQKTCPICGFLYSLHRDGTDPGCPLCSTQVVSINVVEDRVTIEKNQPLPITVNATYKDGHTAAVTDWTTDLIGDVSGTYDAAIYYKSAMDHVQVTILDAGRVTCPYCDLVYIYSEHPEGCPVCFRTLVGIEASLRNGGTQVILGSELNLQIVLIFKDTHRERTYNGWTAIGYNANQIGLQTITVQYQGLSTALTIEVISNRYIVTCPKGHQYYLNEDGSDPGCPICSGTSENDDAVFYFNNTYMNDIIDELYTTGIFYLQKGDYLTVTVSVREKSLRDKINRMFGRIDDMIDKKKYVYGGEVR